ncbi:hypothetical protein GEMRC1_004429 [Eukaryota sp. GEM-RC1]
MDSPSFQNTWIVYPIYFDSKVSRVKGRRVSTDRSIPHPTLDELSKTLDSLSVSFEKQIHKRHPQSWEFPGRILIRNTDGLSLKKTELFCKMGELLPQIRKAEPAPSTSAPKPKQKSKRTRNASFTLYSFCILFLC